LGFAKALTSTYGQFAISPCACSPTAIRATTGGCPYNCGVENWLFPSA